jgi:predicted acylesterase/phospholipase RssA
MAKHTKDSLLENRHGFFNTIISLLLNESLLKTDKLQALAKQLLQAKPLKCDLYIGYTNEDDMTYVSKKFLKGKVYDDLHLHVLASMSIPFLLPMTTVENKHFVDGGIFHALPVEAIQKEMQVSMEKNTAFDLVVLSSKPVDYHLQKYKTKRSFFPASVKASHYMKGIEAIVIHNDNLLMQQLLENAKAKHGLINYSFFHLEQKHVELWDKKIPLQNYGKIKKSDVEELVELGKSIVSNALKLHLKF